MSTYSLADLCQLTDVTARTVRYYVANGLVRPPTGAGPAARYDDGHLYRLRLIRQLQRDHLPLGEIRSRLAALSDEEVQRAVDEPAPVTDSASDYIGRVLGGRGVTRAPGPPRHVGPVAGRFATRPDGTDRAAPVSPAAPAASHHAAALPPAPASPPTALPHTGSPRSQWDRVSLSPDVELHIRRPLSRDANRRVDRLIAIARQLYQEDPS